MISVLNLVEGFLAIALLWNFYTHRNGKDDEKKSFLDVLQVFGGYALAVFVVTDVMSSGAVGAFLWKAAAHLIGMAIGLPQ